VLAGAKSPFLVVADDDFEPMEKRPFAFGAEATRRMNRDAVALTDFGLRGPFVRDREGVGGFGGNEDCEGSAVSGTTLVEGGGRGLLGRARSDLVCCRDRPGVSTERASVDFGCE
jgi:hypothetical protein